MLVCTEIKSKSRDVYMNAQYIPVASIGGGGGGGEGGGGGAETERGWRGFENNLPLTGTSK